MTIFRHFTERERKREREGEREGGRGGGEGEREKDQMRWDEKWELGAEGDSQGERMTKMQSVHVCVCWCVFACARACVCVLARHGIMRVHAASIIYGPWQKNGMASDKKDYDTVQPEDWADWSGRRSCLYYEVLLLTCFIAAMFYCWHVLLLTCFIACCRCACIN